MKSKRLNVAVESEIYHYYNYLAATEGVSTSQIVRDCLYSTKQMNLLDTATAAHVGAFLDFYQNCSDDEKMQLLDDSFWEKVQRIIKTRK